jgi:hypothetical protein
LSAGGYLSIAPALYRRGKYGIERITGIAYSEPAERRCAVKVFVAVIPT